MSRTLVVWVALCSLAGELLAATGTSPAQAYLDALQGSWVMQGSVGKQPVVYQASGERVLNGGFLRLHMVDTAKPPQYQADVFLGYDATADDYVVHWLDQFGAVGARVVASGRRDGDRLVVTFPYAAGAFRDTFTRSAATDSWTLLLESQAKTGAWSTFASYTLQRAPAARKSSASAVPGATKRGAPMERVLGIGGVFFRGRDPQALAGWYESNLGVTRTPRDYGKPVWQQAAGPTVFEPFPSDTAYFGDPAKQWLINFRVANLDAMAAQLRAAGIEVKVDPTRYPNGRFARTHDPEGNPIELWEPSNAHAPK